MSAAPAPPTGPAAVPLAGDDLRRLSELLDEALDLAPEARERWLAAREGGDLRLLPTLRVLLVERSTGEAAVSIVDRCAADALRVGGHFAPGHVVGPYRLIEPIGRGGMGEVWRAERADGQLRRPVALKLPTLSIRRDRPRGPFRCLVAAQRRRPAGPPAGRARRSGPAARRHRAGSAVDRGRPAALRGAGASPALQGRGAAAGGAGRGGLWALRRDVAWAEAHLALGDAAAARALALSVIERLKAIAPPYRLVHVEALAWRVVASAAARSGRHADARAAAATALQLRAGHDEPGSPWVAELEPLAGRR